MIDDALKGFLSALSDNPEAAAYFSSLAPGHRRAIIEHSRRVETVQEMRKYVNSFFQN